MELFDDTFDASKNWLPYDGILHYWGPIFSIEEANHYYHSLLEQIPWRHDEVIIFGKHITTARKIAWYGDRTYEYRYSGLTRKALLWTPLLLEIKAKVEACTSASYNACLLNLYHHGEEGMSWHSDNEKELVKNGSIASVSLGAVRRFAIKHKESKHKQTFELQHGSLLEMKGTTQDHWLHSIPTTKKVLEPRINLTFRQMNV